MPSIKTPFSISSSGKVGVTTTAEKIIEQQIVDIMATSSFERVMRPLYGANAMQLIFEPVDELIYSEFKVEALDQLNKNLSGAFVADIQIAAENSPFISDEDANAITITIKYSMKLGTIRTFSFNLALPSTLTEESNI